jgi:mRNA-degrading endonuclease RelE of RelBE toxin-antitoxin system
MGNLEKGTRALTNPVFSIEFKKTAAKEFAALEHIDKARIAAAIEVLADNPRPHG